MREGQDIDVDQIVERIRQNIRSKRAVEEHPTPEDHVSPFDEGGASVDLAYLHSDYDIERVSFASHRRVLGALVISIKNLLRRLLTPILQYQTAYNAANTRVITHIKEWVGALAPQQAQAIQLLTERAATLERTQAQLHHLVVDAEAQRRRVFAALEAQLRQDVVAVESRLSALHDGHLAAQAQLRQELLATQAHEIGAAESRLRDAFLATHAHEIGAAESRLRDALLALSARNEEMLANHGQQLLFARGQQREELLATESRLSVEITAHAETLQHMRQSGAALRERVSGAERKLRRVLHALGDGHLPDTRPQLGLLGDRPAAPPGQLETEFDYAAFEDRFRGSEEEIKDRQRVYLPYFEGVHQVIDLGCGRGEFLELLRERGIKARGLDLDLDMVLLCRDKGLDVVMADAFAYLETLADDSIGGIFAAQVIEHLPPRRAIELVRLCHRKLEPGGALIMETPNPRCLMIFADSFYKDPSHIQPAHPDAMQFLFESTGFYQVELRFLSPVDPYMRIPPLDGPGENVDQFNHGIERLNSLLFGFLDYAVSGRKSLATP